MVRIGCCHRGDIGRRAHAGFVGEQSPLDTVEHGTGHTARRRLDTKGAFHDQGQHGGHFTDMCYQHIERHQQISTRHERHDVFGHAGNLLDAAKDDRGSNQGYHGAGRHFWNGKGVEHGLGDGIRLHGVEHQPEGQDQAHRKQRRGPRRFESARDVEGRPAPELSVFITDLVKLGQSTFRVRRRHTDRRYHPHPENRPRTAQRQRYRHPSQIARTDA